MEPKKDFEKLYYEIGIEFYKYKISNEEDRKLFSENLGRLEFFIARLAAHNERKNFHDKLNKFKKVTETEEEILKLIIKGYSNKEISIQKFITVNTVKKHVSNILFKTYSKNRSELIVKFSEGLL